jgi:rRNA maturation endonuclease Nob1
MRNVSTEVDMDFEGKCHNCDRKFHPRERKRKWCGGKCRREYERKLKEREAV